jgi:hypothetical protein
MGGLNQNLSLRDLNAKRRDKYYKDPAQEKRILEMNRTLFEAEFRQYKNEAPRYPFLFVFGVPRSGTTISAQILASCLDVGYINNLVARFYLAPLHGLALSNSLHIPKKSSFKSEFAATEDIADLHAFGYFWRYWLKKETVHDFTHAAEKESEIDWAGLRLTLCNIQQAFSKPMVLKNLFGSYHIPKFCQMLENTIFVYIERDDVDTAISILEARKRFYDDLNLWWSNIPLEYEKLQSRDYWVQIGGQVFYLKRFYKQQMSMVHEKHIVRLKYEDLCANPMDAITAIQRHVSEHFHITIELIQPPPHLPFRSYKDRETEISRFKEIFEMLDKGAL